MNKKAIVRAAISIEALNKLKAVKSVPRRQRGKHLVPEYFGNWIEKYTETKEFEYLSKDAEIRRLKATLSSTEILRKFEIQRKNAEIERLTRELQTLTKPLRVA